MWSIPHFCLCLAAIATPCAARITEAFIYRDTRSTIPLSRPFGFVNQGEPFLQFNVSDPEVFWTSRDPKKDEDLNCFGFYLANPVVDTLDVETPQAKCWPNEKPPGLNVNQLASFTDFPELIHADSRKDESTDPPVFTYTEKDPRKLTGGLHTLYFVNCCTDLASVSFDIVTDMYNTVHGEKSYLSLGEIELPTLYLVRPTSSEVFCDHGPPVARIAHIHNYPTMSCTLFADYVPSVYDWYRVVGIHGALQQEQCPPYPLLDDRPGSLQGPDTFSTVWNVPLHSHHRPPGRLERGVLHFYLIPKHIPLLHHRPHRHRLVIHDTVPGRQ